MKDEFAKYIFPEEISDRKFGYMPTNGRLDGQEYEESWREYAIKNNSEFVFIDNTKRGEEAKKEAEKLLSCNILMSAGGNTFNLLNNLREANLLDIIKQFIKKDEFVFAGFSAGAIIMTPSIAAAGQPAGDDPEDLFDENIPQITDLSSLAIVDFEVFPHFDPKIDAKHLEDFKQITKNEVKPLTDEDYILIDL